MILIQAHFPFEKRIYFVYKGICLFHWSPLSDHLSTALSIDINLLLLLTVLLHKLLLHLQELLILLWTDLLIERHHD